MWCLRAHHALALLFGAANAQPEGPEAVSSQHCEQPSPGCLVRLDTASGYGGLYFLEVTNRKCNGKPVYIHESGDPDGGLFSSPMRYLYQPSGTTRWTATKSSDDVDACRDERDLLSPDGCPDSPEACDGTWQEGSVWYSDLRVNATMRTCEQECTLDLRATSVDRRGVCDRVCGEKYYCDLACGFRRGGYSPRRSSDDYRFGAQTFATPEIGTASRPCTCTCERNYIWDHGCKPCPAGKSTAGESISIQLRGTAGLAIGTDTGRCTACEDGKMSIGARGQRQQAPESATGDCAACPAGQPANDAHDDCCKLSSDGSATCTEGTVVRTIRRWFGTEQVPSAGSHDPLLVGLGAALALIALFAGGAAVHYRRKALAATDARPQQDDEGGEDSLARDSTAETATLAGKSMKQTSDSSYP